ncbi:MAG: universal stress protein [Pseudomonadota bacterium]
MFNTLLLAIDINDPEAAVRSTQAAVDMATEKGAVLHVMNVVPDDGMAIVSASLSADHTATVMAETKEGLAAWAKANVPDAIQSELHVMRGTVYDQIIKAASDLGVDAIFVGAHRPALKDYLIGPNAARVARHATQSVFVIR